MKNTSLAAKYRPQSFAEVAGQQMIKATLSRAVAEDKIAPAYLFSGTRGVGKTTIARIFAKALNCRKAPAPEPCNQCDLCRAVTAGVSMDVVEIDGASNRGIDNVRHLKEVVGYAPMEGRYKIFIIDEAHMLSRDAFNALLKTLEEPPAGVTFIMATTEPHKFPATVVSRCQHYVFASLPENELVAHLAHVLEQEKVTFEPSGIRLIARRGAGSVRDSMSLLGQVLAFGVDSITEESVRSVLGLAGHEAFFQIVEAIDRGDTITLLHLVRGFLEQGLDIGFFLRELAGLWRNLFILCQSGEAGLSVVELPAEESQQLMGLSKKFTLAHVHAYWQMTLEGQRRIQMSLEPGLALELLLLNLAMLPHLMSLDGLSAFARKTGNIAPAALHQAPQPSSSFASSPAFSQVSVQFDSTAQAQGQAIHKDVPPGEFKAVAEQTSPAALHKDDKACQESGNSIESAQQNHVEYKDLPDAALAQKDAFASSTSPQQVAESQTTSINKRQIESVRQVAFVENASTQQGTAFSAVASEVGQIEGEGPSTVSTSLEHALTSTIQANAKQSTQAQDTQTRYEQSVVEAKNTVSGQEPALTPYIVQKQPSWEIIVAACSAAGALPHTVGLLSSLKAEWKEEKLVLHVANNFASEKFLQGETRDILEKAVGQLTGSVPEIATVQVQTQRETRESLREKVFELESVQRLEEHLGTTILDFGQSFK